MPREGTPYNNRSLNWDHWSDLAIGQFPNVIARYKQDARWKLPPGLPTGHACEPQYLGTGEPYDPLAPPARFEPHGWPSCCGLWWEPASGGVALGGRRGNPTGGVALGGYVPDLFGPTIPTEGGVEIGGAVVDIWTAPIGPPPPP